MRHTDSLNTTIPTSALQSAETQAGRSPQPARAASGERPANSFLPPAPFAGSQAPAGQLAGPLPPPGDGSADSFDWRGYFHARHKAARRRMLLNAREPERGPVRCERRRLPASIVYTDPIGPKPLSTEWHKIAIRVALDVCARRRISVNEVMGKRRHRYLVLARQEIMWLLHNGSHRFKSLPQIGRWMGGLDHTTVLHGIRSHQRRIDSGEIEP